MHGFSASGVRMTVLYICYQGLIEPLTQTQVVAYLEGVARGGYPVVLLTFEPCPLSADVVQEWERRLADVGITWYRARYHKRPSAPATAWDILLGSLFGLKLWRRHGVSLIHARSHVAGVMALIVKRLTGAKLLFDIRGFMAEEYVDAGTWRLDGVLYRATKFMERVLVHHADGIVVLTDAARQLIEAWYPRELADTPVGVIPCCVDLRSLPRSEALGDRPHGDLRTLVYAGKLGGWYPIREMVAFYAAALTMFPALRWRVWTQSDPTLLLDVLKAEGLLDRVDIGSLPPEQLRAELLTADFGLCLYKRGRGGAGCSPTKLGEYLAAGLPVAASAGVGDVDVLLGNAAGGPIGVTVAEWRDEAYRDAAAQMQQLLDDEDTRLRCRRAAETYFDLERIGWRRYIDLYTRLMDAGAGRAYDVASQLELSDVAALPDTADPTPAGW